MDVSHQEDAVVTFDAFCIWCSKRDAVETGANENAAAMKIQARVRGRVVRKHPAELPALKTPKAGGAVRGGGAKRALMFDAGEQALVVEQAAAAAGEELPLREGWERHVSRSSGSVYYFNPSTGENTYEQPTPPPAAAETVPDETAGVAEPPLPAGWTCQTSQSTGSVYYFNESTGENTYERPTVEPIAEEQPAVAAPSTATVTVELTVPAGVGAGETMEVSFQRKNSDFLLRNPDFHLKNVDFLLKNAGFLLKNDDFIIKTGGASQRPRDPG